MSYGFNNAYQGLIKDTSVIGFITVALVLTAGTALLLLARGSDITIWCR